MHPDARVRIRSGRRGDRRPELSRVVIVGGGIGGLSAALLLGRQGRNVLLCERDPAPVPAGTEEMWSEWPRPGIPQSRLGHTFVAGFRTLLRDRAPDVLERLLDAGAPIVDHSLNMPGDDRREEDSELSSIMCRRPVLDGILRQAVEDEPTVEVRLGCVAVGLAADSSPMSGVPHVIGVHTRGGETLSADTVVVATGRLSPIGRWLDMIGAGRPEEEASACGLHCFTRYFRIIRSSGEDFRVSTRLTVEGELPYMMYQFYGADAGTFCVELLPPFWDDELSGLHREAVWMDVVRALPESAEWLDPARSTPISAIAAMGQERDTLRRFVSDGRPVALGVHVIGDARCQTHSLYAWGSRNALAGAAAVADVMADHPADGEAQALDLEHRIGAELEGRHAYAIERDRALQRFYRGEPEWDGSHPRRGAVLRDVLPAAEEDADVFRAVTRWHLQLDSADALERNADVADRARALAATRILKPRAPRPARETLLRVIAAHA
jgi:2-polyprenyl-6-methoxyphenol hydroxylase-like FAD-dependent oxidoreductase